MAVETPGSSYLNTVDGEIAFFRATMRARPVGIHRHFHILSIRSGIYKDTGVVVSVDDLWEKLRSCWNLDALELLETDGYESPGSSSSTPMAITSPAEGDNVFSHPFFRAEYALPQDEALESMIAIRRARATASPVSPTPPPTKAKRMKTKTRTKRGKSKADMAGLVGGDSDSSALTQESGDEGVSPTPRSTVTGTEAGSEDGADEDVEMAEASPAPSGSSKPAKKTTKGQPKKGAPAAKTRAAAGTSTRAAAAKKRNMKR